MVVRNGGSDDVIRRFLRRLWDTGYPVGHSVRTPAEVAQAARILDSACAMLDSRFLAGDLSLASEAATALAKAVRRRSAWLRQELWVEARDARESEPHMLQFADLKGGRGSLRSGQRLRWMRRLGGEPVLDGVPEAIDTLLRARVALHASGGRGDVLRQGFVENAASWLNVEPEQLVRDVVRARRVIDSATSATGHQMDHGTKRRPRTDTVARSGLVVLRSALEAGQTGVDASDLETADGAGPVLWDAADRSALVAMLDAGADGRRLFEQVRHRPWFDQAIPELRHVDALPQFGPLHEHCVDDHLWRTVDELDNIMSPGTSEMWTVEAARQLGETDALKVAAFFHDAGKGLGGDHSIRGSDLVTDLAGRLGFGRAETEAMARVVRHHLLLPAVATKQDLDDPAVIARAASLIGDIDILRMLYLVAVADARATGPAAWTTWRATLVRSLFARLAEQLDGSRSDRPLREERLDRIRQVDRGDDRSSRHTCRVCPPVTRWSYRPSRSCDTLRLQPICPKTTFAS